VQVIDPKVMGPTFDRVRQSGGAIVTMVRRTEYTPIDGHLGRDEEAVGRALADATIGYLCPEKGDRALATTRAQGPAAAPSRRPSPSSTDCQGTIMVVHSAKDERVMRSRYDAFLAAMGAAPRIERRLFIDCGGDPNVARKEVASRCALYPCLSAFVSIAPWPLMEWSPGPASAPPLPAGCKLITCGAEPPFWPFIESGLCPSSSGSITAKSDTRPSSSARRQPVGGAQHAGVHGSDPPRLDGQSRRLQA